MGPGRQPSLFLRGGGLALLRLRCIPRTSLAECTVIDLAAPTSAVALTHACRLRCMKLGAQSTRSWRARANRIHMLAPLQQQVRGKIREHADFRQIARRRGVDD